MGMLYFLLFVIWIGLTDVFTRLFNRPEYSPSRKFLTVILAGTVVFVVIGGVGIASLWLDHRQDMIVFVVPFYIWIGLTGLFTRLFYRPEMSPARLLITFILAGIVALIVTCGIGFAFLVAMCSGTRF